MGRWFDVASSSLATALRFGAGSRARPAARRPEKLLELYEFEACPFCRRVREALSELDLDAMIYPCPRGGTRYRPQVVELGGKATFPFLVDPNTKRSMYESADIVRYLGETYGAESPSPGWLGPLAIASGSLASAVRAGHGRAARPVDRARETARAVEVRGLPLLPPGARDALRARSPLRPSQRRQRRAARARPSSRHRARGA